jgi:hypothetical protein
MNHSRKFRITIDVDYSSDDEPLAGIDIKGWVRAKLRGAINEGLLDNDPPCDGMFIWDETFIVEEML